MTSTGPDGRGIRAATGSRVPAPRRRSDWAEAPAALTPVEWLRVQMADLAEDTARHDHATATRLAAAVIGRMPTDLADLVKRDRATAALLEAAVAEHTRAALAGHPGWLAEEIQRRGGAPYAAREVF